MRRFFPKSLPDVNGIIKIDGDEFFHLNKVLRVTSGEKVICSYGDGLEHLCEIIETSKTNAVAKILSTNKSDKTPKVDVTLFQGYPKGDKFEFIIQKMVELGLKKIVPFESEFSVSKFNIDKIERFERIAKEACKQCGRSDTFTIDECVSCDEMIKEFKEYDKVIFAYEQEQSCAISQKFCKGEKIAIVIGGEGGFSKTEAEKIKGCENVECVTLGKRILRTETASVALASVVMFLAGEWQ